MDSSEIRRIVHEITNAVASLGADKLRISKFKSQNSSKYRSFATKYPKLYDMCFEPRFDHEQFDMLMSRLDDIQSKRMTFEEGTRQVADHLNNRYVLPLVGAPTRNDGDPNSMDHIEFNVNGGCVSKKIV